MCNRGELKNEVALDARKFGSVLAVVLAIVVLIGASSNNAFA